MARINRLGPCHVVSIIRREQLLRQVLVPQSVGEMDFRLKPEEEEFRQEVLTPESREDNLTMRGESSLVEEAIASTPGRD